MNGSNPLSLCVQITPGFRRPTARPLVSRTSSGSARRLSATVQVADEGGAACWAFDVSGVHAVMTIVSAAQARIFRLIKSISVSRLRADSATRWPASLDGVAGL